MTWIVGTLAALSSFYREGRVDPALAQHMSSEGNLNPQDGKELQLMFSIAKEKGIGKNDPFAPKFKNCILPTFQKKFISDVLRIGSIILPNNQSSE